MRAGSSAKISSVSSTAPDLPASSPAHVDATSPPSGVVAPRPVTTTVRLMVSTFLKFVSLAVTSFLWLVVGPIVVGSICHPPRKRQDYCLFAVM